MHWLGYVGPSSFGGVVLEVAESIDEELGIGHCVGSAFDAADD